MAELALANILGGEGAEQDDPEGKIHAEMLDYDYIKGCSKIDELKGIVSVLKSGKEGSYPQLLKAAEDKLLSILPENERKKYLGLYTTPTPHEISEAEEELLKWESSIGKTDNILRCKTDGKQDTKAKNRSVPAVRGASATSPVSQATNLVGADSKPTRKESNSTSKTNEDQKPQRLSGYDFRAWEKFDVDAAVASVDHEETEDKADESKYREVRDLQALRRLEVHNNEMESLRKTLDADSLSGTEKILRSGEAYLCAERT